eukprot:TRINITY_DN74728_c0_g1_i1.p1 TRINITY_DN74728_c0_g1~~TRINITY_DN74728_c0_g1_i1.p1  ORF type:complete len:996 (-),score=134.56 TRINITY_DN74728_c0_g1_i1:301-3288(-)
MRYSRGMGRFAVSMFVFSAGCLVAWTAYNQHFIIAFFLFQVLLPCLLCAAFCVETTAAVVRAPMSLQPLLPGSSFGRGHASTESTGAGDDDCKRHHESMVACERILQNLRLGKYVSSLSDSRCCVMGYKNRWVTGNVLHYAVWRSSKRNLNQCLQGVFRVLQDEGMQINHDDRFNCNDETADAVRLVLARDVNLLFVQARCDDLHLEAMHFAAGLGSVQAMCHLMAVVRTGHTEFFNRPVVRTTDSDLPEPDGNALHEAAWHGQLHVVEWLLQHEADPQVCNWEGKSPLHLLAMIGGPEVELKGVIELMVQKKARLDVLSNDRSDDVTSRDKVPLEISSLTGSRYPRSLLYLLTRSWHGITSGVSDPNASFIDDLLVLHSARDAEALSYFILHNEKCHSQLRMDGQKEDAPNKIANLIHRAPRAAVDVMDILTVAPEVPDPIRSPITTRASLSGFLENVPMKCTYQTDVRRVKQNRLRWPMWFLWKGTKNSWQANFLADVYSTKDGGRHESMYDVEMKVVLVPNFLDIDILWALARTWSFHRRIFNKLAVQGLITCMWANVIERVVSLDLCFKFIELLCLVTWALEEKSTDSDTPRRFHFQPLCMTTMMACFLRECVQLVMLFCNYHAKSASWEQYDEGSDIRAGPRAKEKRVARWKGSLWSIRAFFKATTALGEFFLSLLPLGAFLAKSFENEIDSDPRSTITQTLHAYTIVSRGVYIFVSLRVFSGIGRKIVAISETVFAKNVIQMLLIIITIFVCTTVAYQSLMPDDRFGVIGMYLYRGAIMGDGDGLDELGLSGPAMDEHTGGDPHHAVMSVMMATSEVIFYIVLLNLAIAVFDREYTKSIGESVMTFHQLRANVAVTNMLQIGRVRPAVWWWNVVRWLIISFCLLVGLMLPMVRPSIYTTAGASVLLAIGQLNFKRILFCTGWMSSDENQERFLWICHRDDFDEDRCHGEDTEIDISDIDNLQRRMTKLEETVNGKLDTVFTLLQQHQRR